MKAFICIVIVLAASACTPAPVEFSKPDKNAPTWDLNPGRWPGTNDLIHEPNLNVGTN
jgi:hypothetical protein